MDSDESDSEEGSVSKGVEIEESTDKVESVPSTPSSENGVHDVETPSKDEPQTNLVAVKPSLNGDSDRSSDLLKTPPKRKTGRYCVLVYY